MAGYFGIGIYHTIAKRNIGTLWRSAQLMDASFVFTVLRKYEWQPSDVQKSCRHLPLFHYDTIEECSLNLPFGSELVGVKMTDDADDIIHFVHPKRAIYILGAEDKGLPEEILALCKKVIKLPGKHSMNVSTAGSIVMYDRMLKEAQKKKLLIV